MIRRPPRSNRNDTLFPYTTRFRSLRQARPRKAHSTPNNITEIDSPPPPSPHPHLGLLAVARLAGAGLALVAAPHHRRLALVLGQPEFLGLQRPDLVAQAARPEGRRVGQWCVSTCRSRWSPVHKKKKQNNKQTT